MKAKRELKRYNLAYYVPVGLPELDEYLSAVKDLGLEAIGTDGFAGWNDPAEIKRITDSIQRSGLKVASCHATIGLIWPDGDVQKSLADNRKVIDYAAGLGSPSTVWHFRWLRGGADGNWADYSVMDKLGSAKLDELISQVLPATCEYASKRGVGINLENLPLFSWARSSMEILQFIRDQRLENLGFILDSGHAWINGEQPADVIRSAGGLFRDTHFVDAIGARGWDKNRVAELKDVPARDLHAIIGMGTINWPEAIRALWEIDFQGPICFEGPGIKGHPERDQVRHWAYCVDLNTRMWQAMEEAAAYWPDVD